MVKFGTEIMSRRDLFSPKVFNNIWSTIFEKKESDNYNFINEHFQSSLYSYPALQELPWEMTLEEAQQNGVNTEGRSRNDIVKDLYEIILKKGSIERT